MEPTCKIDFIFISSSFEVQCWRTFAYICFLQVFTGDSGSYVVNILSRQNQRKKNKISWSLKYKQV